MPGLLLEKILPAKSLELEAADAWVSLLLHDLLQCHFVADTDMFFLNARVGSGEST